MRLHTSLPAQTIHTVAQRIPTVGVARFVEHGSRTHPHAFEVILSGSGNTGGQWGGFADKTATWDEWGIFLELLYRRDRDMRCGSSVKAPVYANRSHFRWATDNRYDDLAVADQHLRHRWDFPGDSLTGAYRVRGCTCGATMRYGSPDYIRQEFPSAVPEHMVAATMRERLERVTVDVMQLRAEVDREYPYDRAKDLAEIAAVEAEDRRILANVRS